MTPPKASQYSPYTLSWQQSIQIYSGIFLENAIAGVKRYNILNHPFRNKKILVST